MRYYSTQRPVMPGGYPQKGINKIHNFDTRIFCESIGRDAWGYVDYEQELSEEEMHSFELVKGSAGYEKLRKAVEKDCQKAGGRLHPEGCSHCGGNCSHRYCDKFKWTIDKAKEYEGITGVAWREILDSWEEDRYHWYMNYYQECNQPKLDHIFDTMEDLKSSIGEMKFRCPSCGEETSDPYECKSCGWEGYGLLGDLGKGVYVFVKEQKKGEKIFMPVAWERNRKD